MICEPSIIVKKYSEYFYSEPNYLLPFQFINTLLIKNEHRLFEHMRDLLTYNYCVYEKADSPSPEGWFQKSGL